MKKPIQLGALAAVIASGLFLYQFLPNNTKHTQSQSEWFSSEKPGWTRRLLVESKSTDARLKQTLAAIQRGENRSEPYQVSYLGSTAVIETRDEAERNALLEALQAYKHLLVAYEDREIALQSGEGFQATDTHLQKQWGLESIRAPEAWKALANIRTPVVVAVIDTGVDTNHPELAANLMAGKNFLDGSADVSDSHGHGSHVAGIIAARANNDGIAGVAPFAKILPLKAMDGAGKGSLSGLLAAVDYAVKSGAKIVNISAGFSADAETEVRYLELIDRHLREAYRNGALVIASAGNGTEKGQFVLPGASKYALAAGGHGKNGEILRGESPPDLHAPGDAILSVNCSGECQGVEPADFDPAYGHQGGASVATAHVSGVAALLKGEAPTLSPDQLRDLLVSSADGGRLRADRALAALGRIEADDDGPPECPEERCDMIEPSGQEGPVSVSEDDGGEGDCEDDAAVCEDDGGGEQAEADAGQELSDADFFEELADFFSDAADGLASAAQGLADSVASAAGSVADALSEIDVLGSLSGAVDSLAELAAELALSGAGLAMDAASALGLDKLAQFFNSLQCGASSCNPVRFSSGVMQIRATDFRTEFGDEGMSIERMHSVTHRNNFSFGRGWFFNYDTRVILGVKRDAASLLARAEGLLSRAEDALEEARALRAQADPALERMDALIAESEGNASFAAGALGQIEELNGQVTEKLVKVLFNRDRAFEAANNAISIAGEHPDEPWSAGIIDEAEAIKGLAEGDLSRAFAARDSVAESIAFAEDAGAGLEEKIARMRTIRGDLTGKIGELDALIVETQGHADRFAAWRDRFEGDAEVAREHEARNAFAVDPEHPEEQLFGNGFIKWIDESGNNRIYRLFADGTTEPVHQAVNERHNIAVLTERPDESYIVKRADGVVYEFGTDGLLRSKRDRNGLGITLHYDTDSFWLDLWNNALSNLGGNVVQPRLDHIEDSFGRRYSFAFEEGRMVSSTDPTGRTMRYEYDTGEKVMTAHVDALGGRTVYEYDEIALVKIMATAHAVDQVISSHNTFHGFT